jgi:Glycosyl hydrolases family 43
MKIIKLLLFLLLPLYLFAQPKVYLISYFTGNGEDGLHFAFSRDGLAWTALKNGQSFLKPTVGVSKLMRDPCILRGPDSLFHLVWTAGWSENGIGYATSKDLVHWSTEQYLPVMAHEPTVRNTWAPEIAFDKKRKEYVIFWASTIPNRFPATDSSGDKGYNHRLYATATKDFKTFSKTTLFFDQGFNAIDATILPMKNKYLMFVKDETRYPPQKNIRVTESTDIRGKFKPVSEPITGKYWAEGPTSIKIGDKYIVYFDKYTEHKMGAVESTDLQNWTNISDKVSFPKGVRHGTVIEISEGELAIVKGE